MPARKSHVITSLSIVCALGFILGMVANRNGHAVEQERYGRFTSREVIDLTLPILQAILPNRNDLAVVTEHRMVTINGGTIQRVWNLDCMDSAGNSLIHITRDADSGNINWLGYDWRVDSVTPHPLAFTAVDAANRAREWMYLLGLHGSWQIAGVPQRHSLTPRSTYGDWSVILIKPGWRAQLVMNEAAGTLIYANIVPVR